MYVVWRVVGLKDEWNEEFNNSEIERELNNDEQKDKALQIVPLSARQSGLPINMQGANTARHWMLPVNCGKSVP